MVNSVSVPDLCLLPYFDLGTFSLISSEMTSKGDSPVIFMRFIKILPFTDRYFLHSSLYLFETLSSHKLNKNL